MLKHRRGLLSSPLTADDVTGERTREAVVISAIKSLDHRRERIQTTWPLIGCIQVLSVLPLGSHAVKFHTKKCSRSTAIQVLQEARQVIYASRTRVEIRSVKRKQNFKRILQLFSEINQSVRWKDSSLGRLNRFVLHRTLFF